MPGVVLALAIRPTEGADMREVERLDLDPKRGVVGDYGRHRRRQVTLLDEAAWNAAVTEAGDPSHPWTTRRANVLIRGMNLSGLVGQTITLGTSRVKVLGEVDPCFKMNEALDGLEDALSRNWRGGVYCMVKQEGSVTIGDMV